MKNPMTPEEQCQAIMDNAAGYDMQRRLLYGPQGDRVWKDRLATDGSDLNFRDCEYRRKPEPVECFANIYINNEKHFHHSLKMAQHKRDPDGFLATICLVEDPTWVEPKPEETNPWRPIVKGDWPECKPDAKIKIRNPRGYVSEYPAGEVSWYSTDAIEWKYAKGE